MATKPKTPLQLAQTALTSWKKSKADLLAIRRTLHWLIEGEKLPAENLLLSVSANTKTIDLPGIGLVWPSESGDYNYLFNPDDNAPVLKNGAFRFSVGRSLESKPVFAFERTVCIVARRVGGVPAPFDNFERLFSHGRDFELVASNDAAHTLTIFHPDPQPDDLGIGMIKVEGAVFSDSFQAYTLRFRADHVCLSVGGKDYPFPIKGGSAWANKPVRFGASGDRNMATSNMEAKFMGFVDRYLSDEEVRTLESKLKTQFNF